jgi:hypothetical protein
MGTLAVSPRSGWKRTVVSGHPGTTSLLLTVPAVIFPSDQLAINNEPYIHRAYHYAIPD